MAAGDTTIRRRIDPNGEIMTELDEIADPHFENHNGSETERDNRFERRAPSGFENPTPRPIRVERPSGVMRGGVTE